MLKAWNSRCALSLPYDKKVEWLQTDGNAYIDTRHKIREALRFEVKASFLIIETSEYREDWLLGDWNGVCYLAGRYINSFRSRIGADDSFHGAEIPADEDAHIWKADDNNCWVDSVKSNTIDWNNLPTTGRNIVVGKSHHVNSAISPRRIYYCKFWDELGSLVLDFIPVRYDSVGYMYDRVSGQLFQNAGTGEFVIGPDK